jgi:hypothetical protein
VQLADDGDGFVRRLEAAGDLEGPPPVTMSHPMAAKAAATRFTSSYTNVPGCASAEPKMATR